MEHNFVQPESYKEVSYGDKTWYIPIVSGFLKTFAITQLVNVLDNQVYFKKYLLEIVSRAPWQIMRLFPKDLIFHFLNEANIRESRKKAIRYLFS